MTEDLKLLNEAKKEYMEITPPIGLKDKVLSLDIEKIKEERRRRIEKIVFRTLSSAAALFFVFTVMLISLGRGNSIISTEKMEAGKSYEINAVPFKYEEGIARVQSIDLSPCLIEIEIHVEKGEEKALSLENGSFVLQTDTEGSYSYLGQAVILTETETVFISIEGDEAKMLIEGENESYVFSLNGNGTCTAVKAAAN